MEAIYDGHDVFMWLPTGYGKSLCFQALQFPMDFKWGLIHTAKSSTVLVISPLVALMIDQRRSRDVKCSIMTSSSSCGVDKDLLGTDSSF